MPWEESREGNEGKRERRWGGREEEGRGQRTKFLRTETAHEERHPAKETRKILENR